MRSETALNVLAGMALADAIPVTLRQLDVIKRLPDVPWRGFDANKVTTSPEAYPFGIADGIPAMGLYLTELGLLALRRRRRRRSKWLDRALAACVAGGAVAAGYYAVQMAVVEKRACVYCIGAIAINFAMVPVAWRTLRGAR
ncbi:MAG: hypothetical protein JWN44_1442 [Myxococcales bacterium]|nr:hypothetical protein [Myxococcales bacterium]